jgi:hypothetical protein
MPVRRHLAAASLLLGVLIALPAVADEALSAWVYDVQSNVQLRRGSGAWEPLQGRAQIHAGDRLRLSSSSRVTLVYEHADLFGLSPDPLVLKGTDEEWNEWEMPSPKAAGNGPGALLQRLWAALGDQHAAVDRAAVTRSWVRRNVDLLTPRRTRVLEPPRELRFVLEKPASGLAVRVTAGADVVELPATCDDKGACRVQVDPTRWKPGTRYTWQVVRAGDSSPSPFLATAWFELVPAEEQKALQARLADAAQAGSDARLARALVLAGAQLWPAMEAVLDDSPRLDSPDARLLRVEAACRTCRPEEARASSKPGSTATLCPCDESAP